MRYEEMRDRAKDLLETDNGAIYSCYLTNADEPDCESPHYVIDDRLDDVIHNGKCQFVGNHNAFFGSGEEYRSEVIDSPTYAEAFILFNESILITEDTHHVYFEEVLHVEPQAPRGQLKIEIEGLEKVPIFEFCAGS